MQRDDTIEDGVYREGKITYLPAGMSEYDLDLDPKLKDEIAEFDKFKTEMLDSEEYAKLTIARQPVDSQGNPAGRKLFQCFECGIDDYTFSQLCTRIRTEYGTGLYKIQARDSQGKFKFHKTIGIQAPKNKDDENSNGANPGVLIDKFSDAMDRHQTRTEMMMRHVLQNNNSKGFDVEQTIKIVTAVTPLLAPVLANIFKPAPSMASQVKEMMLLQEFMQGMRGGDDDDNNSGIYKLLSESVKGFAPLLTAAIAQGQQTGRVNQEGIIMSENPKALAAPEPQQVSPEMQQHKQSLQFLLTQAKADADVYAVVKFVIDAVPDDQLENLEAFLSDDNCIDSCMQMVPEFTAHRAWLVGFQSACINELARILDDDPDNVQDANEPDSAGDALPDTSENATGEPTPPNP